MENLVSRMLARIPRAARGARVVLPDSAVRLARPHATAAELMLERPPGHFLADARALRAGRRIAALAADEGLKLGGAYATFPMKRLGSQATPADVARLAAAFASNAHRRGRKSAKVTPTEAAAPDPGPVAAPRLDEMDVDDAVAAAEIRELRERISGGRLSRRRPTLETIEEENYAAAKC